MSRHLGKRTTTSGRLQKLWIAQVGLVISIGFLMLSNGVSSAPASIESWGAEDQAQPQAGQVSDEDGFVVSSTTIDSMDLVFGSPITGVPTAHHPTLQPSTTSPSSKGPTKVPTTLAPTSAPSHSPSLRQKTGEPTRDPSPLPTTSNTARPSYTPSVPPTLAPSTITASPTSRKPSVAPITQSPSRTPTIHPTSSKPTKMPTTQTPSHNPSKAPSLSQPTRVPSRGPSTNKATKVPSQAPSKTKTSGSPLSSRPSQSPSIKTQSTARPSRSPSRQPATSLPTRSPTTKPTLPQPTATPSRLPTISVSTQSPSKRTEVPSSTSPSPILTSRPTISAAPTTLSPSTETPLAKTASPSLSTAAPIMERPRTATPSRNPTTAERRFPSIMLMMADDLDYQDVEYSGGYARTPNINSLAASSTSLRMDNFHSASAVCSPSRLGLLTGRNPERDCIFGALLNDKPYKFRYDAPSLARFARKAGYRTAFFAKWHLGRYPGVLGFEYSLASPANVPTYDPGCFCAEQECMTGKGTSSDKCYRVAGKSRISSRLSEQCEMGHFGTPLALGLINWTCDLRLRQSAADSGNTVSFPRNITTAQYMAQKVAQYLDTLQPSESFLVQLSFYEPHEPFIASAQDRANCARGMTCRQELAQDFPNNMLVLDYYSAVAAIDQGVGIVLDKLRRLDRFEDTIVIFCSDNGGETPEAGGVPANPVTRALKGYKRSVYEGGTRVPAVISWPARIKSNSVVTQVTSMLDITATAIDAILEIDPSLEDRSPKSRLDGVSWLPLIANIAKWTRGKSFGVCQPLSVSQKSLCETFAYYEDRYKVVYNSKTFKVEVYDTISDPFEKKSLGYAFSLMGGLLQRAKNWKQNVMKEAKTGCSRSTRALIGDIILDP